MDDKEVDAILATALARGYQRQIAMIEESGGLLTTADAAVAAGLTPEDLLLRQNKSLLAVPIDGDVGWPRFQFESEAFMDAVAHVLQRIGVESPWMRLNFFLMRLDELGGVRPIDAIRAGNLRAVELAAYHFGRHGAS